MHQSGRRRVICAPHHAIRPDAWRHCAKQHTYHGTSRHGMCARVRTTGGAECSLFVLLVDCRRLQRLSVTNFGCPFEARGRAEAAGPMLSVSCIIALIALCVGVSDSSPIRPAAPSAASGRYAFSVRWLASRPTLVGYCDGHGGLHFFVTLYHDSLARCLVHVRPLHCMRTRAH